jgi:hypothetical protein
MASGRPAAPAGSVLADICLLLIVLVARVGALPELERELVDQLVRLVLEPDRAGEPTVDAVGCT